MAVGHPRNRKRRASLMIDLYTSATPNGWKATITLEELELPYTLHTVDLSAGDQHTPEFLALIPLPQAWQEWEQEAAGNKPREKNVPKTGCRVFSTCSRVVSPTQLHFSISVDFEV